MNILLPGYVNATDNNPLAICNQNDVIPASLFLIKESSMPLAGHAEIRVNNKNKTIKRADTLVCPYTLFA